MLRGWTSQGAICRRVPQEPAQGAGLLGGFDLRLYLRPAVGELSGLVVIERLEPGAHLCSCVFETFYRSPDTELDDAVGFRRRVLRVEGPTPPGGGIHHGRHVVYVPSYVPDELANPDIVLHRGQPEHRRGQ